MRVILLGGLGDRQVITMTDLLNSVPLQFAATTQVYCKGKTYSHTPPDEQPEYRFYFHEEMTPEQRAKAVADLGDPHELLG